MFELNHSAYYRNVPAFDELTAKTTSNGTVVEFWKNLYSSVTDTRDCSGVVQEAFMAANDEGDLEITLTNVYIAVKCTHNWSASGRDTV